MQLIDEPAPDFSDPIGLLRACHDRMLKHCELLERMCAYQDENGLDDDLIQSAKKVLRYFDNAAEHHHADEETDLFPHLMEQPEIAVMLKALTAQHGLHNMLWDKLRTCLQTIADGETCPQLAAHSRTFVSAYRAHIDIENNRLLPLAEQVLDQTTRIAIGRAMAARRGVTL